MYMCSNTGLSGWAELRNRTRLCFHTTHKPLIRTAVRIHILPERGRSNVARHPRTRLATSRLAFSSAHLPRLPLDLYDLSNPRPTARYLFELP
jgi:hypothetical protein